MDSSNNIYNDSSDDISMDLEDSDDEEMNSMHNIINNIPQFSPFIPLNSDVSNNISNIISNISNNITFVPFPPPNISHENTFFNSLWRNIMHQRPLPINNILSPHTIDNFTQSTFEDENKFKYVISEEGEEKITKLKYSTETYGDITVCPISRENFKEGDSIIELPCKHIFTEEMGLIWLKKKDATCPVCRYKLPSMEVKKNPKEESFQNELPPPRQHSRSFGLILRDIIDKRMEELEENDIQQAIYDSLLLKEN